MTRAVVRVLLPTCVGVCLLAALPGTSRAQQPVPDRAASGEVPGALAGVVTSGETGLPVAGAEIVWPGSGRAVTDAAGRFRLDGIPVGAGRFRLGVAGLPSRTLQVDIEAGAITRLDLRVATRLVPVPSLDVEVAREAGTSGKLAGFYRRRARGIGWFLDREAIARRAPREVSDLLRSLPGLSVSGGPGSTGDPRMDRSAAFLAHRSCRIGYFVDGVRIPAENAFRLDELSPQDLEAVEVYRGISEVPAVFVRVGEECGVVAVWTRDPARP